MTVSVYDSRQFRAKTSGKAQKKLASKVYFLKIGIY